MGACSCLADRSHAPEDWVQGPERVRSEADLSGRHVSALFYLSVSLHARQMRFETFEKQAELSSTAASGPRKLSEAD